MSTPRATSQASEAVIVWAVVLAGALMVAAVFGYGASMVYAMTLWN
jgi:hypothetical protein